MNLRNIKSSNPLKTSLEASKEAREILEDDEIWEGVISKDEKSIELLYKKYASALCKYGFQITKEESLVYDSLQDTFLYLIQKSKKLSQKVHVKAYLYACYRRRLLSAIKAFRKSHEKTQPISDHEDYFENPEPKLFSVNESFRGQVKDLILAASTQLTARQQEVIYLHFYEGLSYQDIAETMQFQNVKSARNLLYKSIDILSVSLKKYKSDIWPLILFFVSGSLSL